MNRLREIVVRATPVSSRDSRKTKTYPAGRTCEVCDQPLSRYNPSVKQPNRCWAHQIARFRNRAVPKQGA